MLISDRTRYGMALARSYLRSALAALPQDAATDTVRHVLPSLIRDFDAKIGTDDEPVPGDHDEDCRRCGVPVADGWHPKEGGTLVPVEPYQSAGLRLPAWGDCRGSYVSDLDRYRSVNPPVPIFEGADAAEFGPAHRRGEC
jgi:hypothetical protein